MNFVDAVKAASAAINDEVQLTLVLGFMIESHKEILALEKKYGAIEKVYYELRDVLMAKSEKLAQLEKSLGKKMSLVVDVTKMVDQFFEDFHSKEGFSKISFIKHIRNSEILTVEGESFPSLRFAKDIAEEFVSFMGLEEQNAVVGMHDSVSLYKRIKQLGEEQYPEHEVSII